MNPQSLNKYLYIEKTPTWLIRSFYGFGIVAWLLVVTSFIGGVLIDPFIRWFVGPLLLFFTAYHLCTYSLACFYRRFDLEAHFAGLLAYWKSHCEPAVDIFLPICGEELAVLKNTWTHVSRLNYKNKKVYVLDDSPRRLRQHKQLAEQLGFIYLARPNRGEMKKAGNLKYGYERSDGDFIAIFDADFAPHTDFLSELLPYMGDPRVGIVQSPQYFDTTSMVHNYSPVAYGAAQVQEAFYRFIQVARDRFNGTICCGSNAIYRRSALKSVGGFVQISHSEDAHTGFAVSSGGWTVRYVPIILAVGMCPDNVHSYFHQQHRWCFGSMSLLSTKKFWSSPVSWMTKFCYLCGFLFYLNNPVSLVFSFQLFWTLFFYNQYINLADGIFYYPYMVWGFSYLFLFPIARFRRGSWYATFVQLYAYSHAVLSSFANRTVGWIPTNTKMLNVSSAFKQATLAACAYLFIYVVLIALAIRSGVLHPFDFNYYSVQFWIFYNFTLSSLLLLQMYRAMVDAQNRVLGTGLLSRVSLAAWGLKTAGLYVLLLAAVVGGIAYL